MPKRSFKIELRTPRLRSWLEHGLVQLVERVQGKEWRSDVQRFEAEVQRFGDQAWRKIATRWPVLADLVRDSKVVRARYRAPERKPPEPREPQTMSNEAVDALIAQLIAADPWQARQSAALALARIEADGVVLALVQALRDSSAEVAVAAVDALANHSDPEATNALLSVLANTEGFFNPMTRVAAIAALSKRLRDDALAPITTAVRDIDAEVSIAAIAVTVDRVPSQALDQLLPILRDGEGYFLPLVRLAAANALDRAGLLGAPLRTELLQTERDPALRRVLERALSGSNQLGHNPAPAT